MTRKEYMKKLEDALSPLPEKTREAALNFCQEMLDDRMEDGMDEEAAVAAMENPVAIASRLGAEPGETVDLGNLTLPNREDYLEFARLSDAALEGVDKALQQDETPQKQDASQPTPEAPADSSIPDIAYIVRQAMDAARQGIEMGQRAVRQAVEQSQQAQQSETLGDYEKKTLTCPINQLKSVCLACSNMPILIVPCQGDTATLTYYTSPKDPYAAYVKNNVLLLEHQGNSKTGVKFNIFGIRFFLESAQPTVKLFLPSDALVDLLAHTSNGSVKLSGLSSLCLVDVQTSNCRIEAQDIVCKSMTLKTSNARLVVKNVAAKLSFNGKTSNARIEMNQVVSNSSLILHSSNAHISLSRVATKTQLEAITSNGHIQADHIAGSAVTLKTSNAGIRGSLQGRQQDYAIDSGTSNGSNSLPKSQPGTYPLSVHTSNGTIQFVFE